MRKLLRAGLVICLASALMLFPVGATTFQPQQGSASSSSSTTGYQTPTPSVTVGVNWTAFYGSQPILISGTVGPLSPPIMEVLVSVDSYDAPVSIASVPVNDSTGDYSYVLVPSGLGCGWIASTYSVTATYTYIGQVTSATTHFEYTPGTAAVGASTSSTSSTTTCPSIYSLATGVTVTTTTTTTQTSTTTMPPSTTTSTSTRTVTVTTSTSGTAEISTFTTTTTTTKTLAVISQSVPSWAYAAMAGLLIAGLGAGYGLRRPRTDKSTTPIPDACLPRLGLARPKPTL